MTKTSGLTVRQYERAGLELPAELELSVAHAAQVRFSANSSAVGPRIIRGRAVDISSGGLGVETNQFLPRMAEGTVRVFCAHPTETDRDGNPVQSLVFEQMVKVRRVAQSSREPAYALGLAFVDAPSDIERRIMELLNAAGRVCPAAAPNGAGDVQS